MYRAPPPFEGNSSKKDQNPDNKLKRPSEAMELSGELNPCCNSLKRQRVTDQTGLPAISTCSELDKAIYGIVTPIVRYPQNSKPSKSCTGEDAIEQDIHLAEGFLPVLPGNPDPLKVKEDGGCLRASCCMDVQTARIIAQVSASRGSQPVMSGQQELEGEIKGAEQMNGPEEANGSPTNEVVNNKQQVGDSEEAAEPPSSDISKRISLVETIYAKRIEKLLANQSKKCLQFKEARDRIKNDLTKKLRNEHSNASVLVRKTHPGVDARIVGLKNVDKEFIRKGPLITTHLIMEQVKFDSIHEADMEEERKLKSHWMHEAQSGRSVDGYSILPQFLDSCFNLDILKKCEQFARPSEVIRGRSPVPEGTIPTEPSGYLLNSAFRLTDPLPSNQSNDDISAPSPHTQPQQHPPAISSSEPLGPLLSIPSDTEIPVFSQAEELQASTRANSPSDDDISAPSPHTQPQQHLHAISSSEPPLGPLLSILSDTESPVFSQAEQLQISTRPDSPSEPVLLYSSSSDTSFQSYNGGFSSNNQSNAAAAAAARISSRTRSKQSRGLF